MNFKHLHESIIDEPQETENPFIWRDKKINPLIRIKIVDILTELKVIFRELVIVGSITGKFWSFSSDIDVTVFVDVDLQTLANYRKLSRVVSERHFFGPFAINFYFRTDTIEDMKALALADGIYDLLQDKWILEPADVDEVEEVLSNPKKLAARIAKRLDTQLDDVSEMIQGLVEDYKTGGDFEEKLNLLQLELDDYVNSLDAIHKKRTDEFQKSLEGADLGIVQKYRSRNFLPWNVVYKLLVKWLYFKWQSIFKDELKDSELKKSELKDLMQRFVRYWV